MEDFRGGGRETIAPFSVRASQRSTRIVARNLGDGAMFGGFTATSDGRMVLFAKRDSTVNDLMLVENFR